MYIYIYRYMYLSKSMTKPCQALSTGTSLQKGIQQGQRSSAEDKGMVLPHFHLPQPHVVGGTTDSLGLGGAGGVQHLQTVASDVDGGGVTGKGVARGHNVGSLHHGCRS